MSIIAIDKINFGYQRNQPILKDLVLNVPEGSIYGFLGANGAGKSTTIRNILGLLKFESGNIQLFGKNLNEVKPRIFGKMGSLIESPSLYPHLDAVNNLKIACKYKGVSYKNIDPILKKIGLYEDRKKSTKKYSTGMKQRLGLGIALINDPELLILDEPTNGLDPNGIKEIRNIIKELNQEGKTIMLSSHILSEIEKIASHVGIINKGQMLFEGTMDKLMDLKSHSQSLSVRSAQPEKLLLLFPSSKLDEGWIKINFENEAMIPKKIEKMVKSGIDIFEVKVDKSNLENIFMNITNN